MRRALPLMITATVLIGCGGGDGDDAADNPPTNTAAEARDDGNTEGSESADSSTSAPEDTTAATTDQASAADDRAVADEAVLKLSDFEPGWRADEPDEEDDESAMDECDGFDAFDDDTPSADSEKFVRDEAEVQNGVAVLATEEEADDFMQLLVAESTVECLRAGMTQLMEDNFEDDADAREQFEGVSTSVGRVSVGEFGDDAAGYQVEVTLEGDFSLSVYVDFLVVRQGRALSLFSFVDVFSPFDGDRDALVQAVLDRLTNANI